MRTAVIPAAPQSVALSQSGAENAFSPGIPTARSSRPSPSKSPATRDVPKWSPASDAATDDGNVLVFYGSSSGLLTTGTERLNQPAAGIASNNGDAFGKTLVAGDFDTDGRDDLALGIPSKEFVATDDGIVLVFYGSSAGLLPVRTERLSQVDAGRPSENGDHFGASLAVGDFNGEGHDDLAIGIPDEFQNAPQDGAVLVFYGSQAGLIPATTQLLLQSFGGETSENDDRFGAALAAGDFDGDERDDLAVAIPGEDVSGVVDVGTVIVFYGSSSGLLTTTTGTELILPIDAGGAPESGDMLGTTLAAADYNGDCRADLLIGAPQEDIFGAADAGALYPMAGAGRRFLGAPIERIGGVVCPCTPTPTPTAAPVFISGTISYCSNPVPGPVPNVTVTLTGTMSGSTLSNGSGNYTLSSVPSGGNYTVTPTKAAHVPGSAGINTVDVVATQRQFLNVGTPLSGCRLTAGDVNGVGGINTVDVIAIQRFFLGLSTGIANTGKYQFTPVNKTYIGLVQNMTGQNYAALVFGDLASTFVHRPEGPLQDAAGDDGMSAGEAASTVAAVSLPNVAVDAFVSNFIVQVTTTTIDAKNKLVGFQGDITFDERVVTFQSEPVQKAGLTGGNWNVSGNVLDGPGPMRTLRISAYSLDFAPLSGKGTLFELRMTMVSEAAQDTQLIWAAPPDDFMFIDADLKTQKPGDAVAGSVAGALKRE